MATPASESKDAIDPTVAAFAHLEQHGYVVIPNVLSGDECNATINAMWQWLATISGETIQRGRSSTWAEPSEDHPSGKWPFCYREKGIIQWYQAGHQQFVWDIRQHPSVVAIFAKLWGCDARDLLVSFDAINIQRPIEYLDTIGITGYTDRFNDSWLHIDQSAGVRGRVCVQAFVNLNDSAEDDGCLIVCPGSHLLHEALCNEFKVSENPQQWIRLHDRERRWYRDHGCQPLRVVAPRGSLVMWDSRTVHTAGTAQPNRINKNAFRYVVYVCCLPRSLASEQDLVLKRRLLKQGRMTSHWPVKFIKDFGEFPPVSKQLLPRYEPVLKAAKTAFRPPKLTELGRRLAGLE